jgi:AAA domain
VITSVLGAPGSGKTAVRGPLAASLPTCAVVDWDAFIEPAGALAGCAIRENPATWPAYRQLVRTVLDVLPGPVVLLSVCAPAELADWPIDGWVVLDCSDEERARRLGQRADASTVREAIEDAQEYRLLGLPAVDSTGRTPEEVAGDLARFVRF